MYSICTKNKVKVQPSYRVLNEDCNVLDLDSVTQVNLALNSQEIKRTENNRLCTDAV